MAKMKNDKGSVLIDAERLLDTYEPAFMNMPKIMRIHGPAVRMEEAVYDLIDNFYIAYELGTSQQEIEEKLAYIAKMIGAYGRMQTAFKRLCKIKIDSQKKSSPEAIGQMSLLSDNVKLEVARCMERIEEGIIKWRSSLRASRIMSSEAVSNSQKPQPE